MKQIKYIFSFFFVALSLNCLAQNNTELDKLIEIAIKNNRAIKAKSLTVESSKENIRSAWDIDKTKVYYSYDSNNKADNDKALKVFGIEQEFLFPTVYNAQRNVNKSVWEQNKALLSISRNQLAFAVSLAYDQIVYLQNKEILYLSLDSLYFDFAKAGNRKFELGETTYLEKITSSAKTKQINTILQQIKKAKKAAYSQLYALMQNEEEIEVSKDKLELLSLNNQSNSQELQKDYLDKVSDTFSRELKLQNQNWLPNLSVEFFSGTNSGLHKRLNGFQIGVSIPLIFNSNIAKRKAAKLSKLSWEIERNNKKIQMENFATQKSMELQQQVDNIRYYTEDGKQLSAEILKTANLSYKNGEIDFFQYIQSVENSTDIEVQYLESVLAYNRTYLELYYFNFNQ